MRLICTSGLLISFVLTGPAAAAAEIGTYRPGPVYQSSTAPAPDLCASQCSGDAQCKAWNFVRLSDQKPSGICELLSAQTRPVRSEKSISGLNGSALSSPRLIGAGSRTLRVGQSASTAPQPAQVAAPQTQAPLTGAASRPAATTRRVVREAAPQRFEHALDPGAGQPQLIQSRTATQAAPRDASTGLSFQERQLRARLAEQAPRSAAQPPTAAKVFAAPAPAPAKPPVMTPKSYGIASSDEGYVARLPETKVRQSLFGSLYDDVRAPKPLETSDIPQDPNAPIVTTKAVPVKDVLTEDMMAGAPSP